MAFKQTQFQIDLQRALHAEEPARSQLLDELAKKLEGLYATHAIDAKVATAADVSVATLKRLIAKLGEHGHAPKISRPRGRRWAPKRRRRSPLQSAQA